MSKSLIKSAAVPALPDEAAGPQPRTRHRKVPAGIDSIFLDTATKVSICLSNVACREVQLMVQKYEAIDQFEAGPY
jgi:hypothetical protein